MLVAAPHCNSFRFLTEELPISDLIDPSILSVADPRLEMLAPQRRNCHFGSLPRVLALDFEQCHRGRFPSKTIVSDHAGQCACSRVRLQVPGLDVVCLINYRLLPRNSGPARCRYRMSGL